MQYMAMTADKLRDDLKEPAVTQIKQQLALDAVVAAEGITISDEEVDEEVKKAAANLNVPYEQVIEGLDKEPLKVDLARDKAMALVAAEGKPHLVAAEDDGDIKVTEVTRTTSRKRAKRKQPARKPPPRRNPRSVPLGPRRPRRPPGKRQRRSLLPENPEPRRPPKRGRKPPRKPPPAKRRPRSPRVRNNFPSGGHTVL